MAEAYILEEVSNFTTKYYADNLPSVQNPTPRYNAGAIESNLSLFQGQLGSASCSRSKFLTLEEWRTIMLYVLTNLSEVEPYITEFLQYSWRQSRDPTPHEIDTLLREGGGPSMPEFISWFSRKVPSNNFCTSFDITSTSKLNYYHALPCRPEPKHQWAPN